jgi:hypothetical protein
VKEDEASFKA